MDRKLVLVVGMRGWLYCSSEEMLMAELLVVVDPRADVLLPALLVGMDLLVESATDDELARPGR